MGLEALDSDKVAGGDRVCSVMVWLVNCGKAVTARDGRVQSFEAVCCSSIPLAEANPDVREADLKPLCFPPTVPP